MWPTREVSTWTPAMKSPWMSITIQKSFPHSGHSASPPRGVPALRPAGRGTQTTTGAPCDRVPQPVIAQVEQAESEFDVRLVVGTAWAGDDGVERVAGAHHRTCRSVEVCQGRRFFRRLAA